MNFLYYLNFLTLLLHSSVPGLLQPYNYVHNSVSEKETYWLEVENSTQSKNLK